MRKFALSFALLVAGLFTFAATPAQAQSVDFGISIGSSNGGVSVHVGNGRYGHGGYYHRHYPGCSHDYGWRTPRYQTPRHYYTPRPVLVYETRSGWVYNQWTGRNEWRQWTVERWVTPYYSSYYGCYGYTDSYGNFRCVR